MKTELISTTPHRFDPVPDDDAIGPCCTMNPHTDGDWVRHADYADLLQQRDDLLAALKLAANELDCGSRMRSEAEKAIRTAVAACREG